MKQQLCSVNRNAFETQGANNDDMSPKPRKSFEKHPEYQVDSRPLCQGLPFVLTDSAHPRLVLKHGNQFMVLDREASIPACNTLGFGYYRNDTRHLSQWEILLDDVALSLLSFDVEKGYAGSFLYTNPQTPTLSQQKLMVQRQILISDTVYERLVIENFSAEEIAIKLRIKCQSDFADMFEVRGLNRPERGQRMIPTTDRQGRRVFLAYKGADDILLETIVEFDGQKPDSLTQGEATYQLLLPVRTPWVLDIRIYTRDIDSSKNIAETERKNFQSLLIAADQQFLDWRGSGAQLSTKAEIVNLTIERSLRDIYILRQSTPKGPGLAAGIPWYCAVFGRDSAIAAMQLVPFYPEIARECIEVLAAYQGTQTDEFRAERPGKIMHELRLGELARLNIIPHTPYYGTVDATSLWLIALERYLQWTGDLQFAERLWPNVQHALTWLENNGDGYLSYKRESPQGLENQGWKDSGNSICHLNGSLAIPPIALCEAQGYLYASLLAIANIGDMLGHSQIGAYLRLKAKTLKVNFINDFWLPAEQFLALALDFEGRQVKAIASNAGHCIWTGILDGAKAEKVVDRLLSEDMDTGWGLRTLSSTALTYSPMSYHNGSVWPHDNAIIMDGMRKIGRIRDAHQLMSSLIDVAQHQQDFRLPELFCGFERSDWSRPIDYPVSCSPQAWSAGSIFQMIGSCLNFQPDATKNVLRIIDPSLPPWMEQVTVRNLKVGKSSLDIAFNVANGQTFCQILRKAGDLRVIIET
ncbi:MAG: amylo-alpha-1,6-glucosidase [Cyanobacteria bacterium SZAS LIN-2]|nr:amylo-alpha-1,6-glucosidase [Cyanobacteria bacterium SZAS LIN-2]